MRRWTILAAIALVVVLAATAAAQPGLVRVVVNGKNLVSDVPAQIVNDRTMIPLRAVSEAMGWKVEWDSVSRTATIQDAASLEESSYRRALNGAVIFALSLMRKGSMLLDSVKTPDDLARAQQEMLQNRAATIGFLRLRPPVQYQQAHTLMGAVLSNLDVSLSATLQMKEIQLDPNKYSPSEGIEVTRSTNARAKAATTAAGEAFYELLRLLPELKNIADLNSDKDIEWFTTTIYAAYPEGWPK